jgi:hypothetical protein
MGGLYRYGWRFQEGRDENHLAITLMFMIIPARAGSATSVRKRKGRFIWSAFHSKRHGSRLRFAACAAGQPGELDFTFVLMS